MMEVPLPENGNLATKLEISAYEIATILASATVVFGSWAGILALSPGFPLAGPTLLISTAILLVFMDKKFYGDGPMKTWNLAIRLATCVGVILLAMMFVSGRNKILSKLFPGVQQRFNYFITTLQMQTNTDAFLGIVLLLCFLRIFEYCYVIIQRVVEFGFIQAFQSQ